MLQPSRMPPRVRDAIEEMLGACEGHDEELPPWLLERLAELRASLFGYYM